MLAVKSTALRPDMYEYNKTTTNILQLRTKGKDGGIKARLIYDTINQQLTV